MNEPRHDYLWDPQQPADADLQALERALAPLRYGGRALDPSQLARVRQCRPGMRRWGLAATSAAAALLLLGWLLWSGTQGELVPGAPPRRFVATDRTTEVKLGDLAAVELEPGSELRFEHWRADEARFSLQRGGIAVRVAPPPAVAPRFFTIDTPRGRVVDLGCRYELRLHRDGREYVRVTEGAVEFAYPRRTVFVPAGAECTVADDWPGTPLFTDRPGQLADVIAKFDAMTQLGAPAGDRVKLAEIIAERCRGGRDTLPLWHLLRDPEPAVRSVAEARLVEVEGLPPGGVDATKLDPAHADPGLWLPFLRLGAWTRSH